ncbi:hypothetical protein GHT06_017282 [Daphnia sinensis]|uniref:Uncharacterized protein n=1 Tax=Daphnia sinensis TaxID=1820382 RepID=A0AAD5KQL4_9CRUS|nr:hypothetical protein GHT06_017282 [Daphnia sinensis]
MTKALQLLYWLHVCSTSQQWETAQVYDEILDFTLDDDITAVFIECGTQHHLAGVINIALPSNGRKTRFFHLSVLRHLPVLKKGNLFCLYFLFILFSS